MRRSLVPVLSTLALSAACSSTDGGDGHSEDQALAISNGVAICHIPPSAPEDAETIVVAQKAVAAHLAHGDLLGECPVPICVPGTSEPCYGGPVGTEGVGTCSAGTQTCNSDGSAYGACTGSVTPQTETCGDDVDNDCDGSVDDGCLGDRVWNDTNRNGVQEAGEPGVAGAIVFLRSGSTGGLIQVASSNANGTYFLAGVPAGTYYLEIVTPAGMTLTEADVVGDDNLDSDFDSETATTAVFSFTGSATFDLDGGCYSVIQG